MEKANDLTIVRNSGMTSLEIANVTGKNHRDVMRDIRNLLDKGVSQRNFALSSYKQPQPNGGYKDVPCYNLTPKGCLILASGYDALLREKIINRLEELEVEKRTNYRLPKPDDGFMSVLAGIPDRNSAVYHGILDNQVLRLSLHAYSSVDELLKLIDKTEAELTETRKEVMKIKDAIGDILF